MSLSLYAAYLKEREDFQLLEREDGFATYKILGDELYLRDIFVSASRRLNKVASEIANEVASIGLRAGCKYMSGTVSVLAKNPTAATTALIRYGFHIVMAQHETIYFRKDL